MLFAAFQEQRIRTINSRPTLFYVVSLGASTFSQTHNSAVSLDFSRTSNDSTPVLRFAKRASKSFICTRIVFSSQFLCPGRVGNNGFRRHSMLAKGILPLQRKACDIWMTREPDLRDEKAVRETPSTGDNSKRLNYFGYESSDVVKLRVGLGELVSVELEKPLGVLLEQTPAGCIITDIAPGSNADLSGKVHIGDRMAAVSATFGNELWLAEDLARVVSAIKTRKGPVTVVLDKAANQQRTPSPVAVQPPTFIPTTRDEWLGHIRTRANEMDVLVARQIIARMDAQGLAVDDAVFIALAEACLTADNVAEARKILEQLWAKDDKGDTTRAGDVDGNGEEEEEEGGTKPQLPVPMPVPMHVDDVYEMVFTYYIRLKQLPRAIFIASKLEQGGAPLSVGVYNMLMSDCIASQDPARALLIFERMKEVKRRPNAVTYTLLIKAYGKQKKIDEAFRVLDEMQLNGEQPNIRNFNALISACAADNDMGRILRLFGQMSAANVHPDHVSWNILINWYAKRNKVDKAFAAFADMKEQGVSPDLRTYTPLLQMCVRRGDLARALKLFQEMRKSGVKPDDTTYAQLIKGYGDAHMLDKALAIWRELKQEKRTPAIIAYNNLIKACANNKRIDLVEKNYNELIQSGLQPNVLTYAILISCYGKAKRTMDALLMFNEMTKRGIVPNAVVFASLMSACLEARDLSRVDKLLATMRKYKVEPDVVVYTVLLQRYFVVADLKMVDRIQWAMNKKKITPTIVTYNVLIGGLIYCGDPPRALKALEALFESGITPTYGTFHALLYGYGSAKRSGGVRPPFPDPTSNSNSWDQLAQTLGWPSGAEPPVLRQMTSEDLTEFLNNVLKSSLSDKRKRAFVQLCSDLRSAFETAQMTSLEEAVSDWVRDNIPDDYVGEGVILAQTSDWRTY